MNYTSTNINVSHISTPGIGLPFRNIFVLIISIFLLSLATTKTSANVIFTPPSLTTYACNGTFPTAYSALGNIVITEGNSSDFANQSSVTLILTAPANFEFLPGTGSANGNGQNVTVNTTVVSSTTITITYTSSNTNKNDILTISGIQVRGINTVSGPSAILSSGSGTITGITNGTTSFGTLSSVNQTLPVITSSSTSPVCTGVAQNYAISSSIGGTTYSWSRVAVAGISNVALSNQTGNPITESLINTTTSSVDVTYVITPTVNGCTGTPFNYVVTVNSLPSITTQPASQSVCMGSSGTFNVTVAGTAPLSYQWRKSGLAISGATSSSYTTGTTGSYDVIVTNSCGFVTSTAVTLANYSALITGTFTTTSVTACVNYNPGVFTITGTSGGSGSYTYQWQLNGSDFAGANSITYNSPNLSTAGTYVFNAVVKDAICNTTASTATKTITIVADPTVAINFLSGNGIVCQNTSVSLTSVVSGGVSNTYEWQSSPNNSTWSVIAGATAATYSPPTPVAGTLYYRLRIPNGASCNQAYSNVLTVIVNAYPSAPTAADGVSCGSGNVTINATGCSGTLNWYAVSTGGSSLSTASPFTTPFLTNTTNYYVTCTVNGCESTTRTQVAAIINPVSPGNIGTDQGICNGNPSLFISIADATASGNSITLAYQWQISTNNTSWSDISGATASTYDAPAGVTVTTYYRRKVTGTHNGTGVLCTGYSNTVTVIIYTLPVITTDIRDTSICKNNDLTFIAAASGTPAPTAQWQVSTNGGSSFTNIAGANNPSYTLTGIGTNLNGNVYQAIFTNACGSVTTHAAILTVGAPILIGGSPANATGCDGSGSVSFTGSGNGGNGLVTMSWQYSIDGVNWIDIPGTTTTSNVGNFSTTYTFTPTSADAGKQYRAKFSNGGCAQSFTNAAILSINTTPVFISQPTNQVECNGVSTAVINFSASNATTYTWTNNNTAIGLASSGSGNIGSFTATNVTTNPIIATITVTPVNGAANVNCPGTPATFTITVNPSPSVTNSATANTCSGSSPNISLTSTLPSTFTWTIGTFTGGITGASAGNGSVINQVLTDQSSTTAGTVQYIVTPSTTANLCPGSPYIITVTVNPAPIVTTAATKTICSGASSNIALTSSVPATFAWTIGTVTGAITGASAGSGTPINQTLTNPSTSVAGTVQYIVTPTATTGSCMGAPYTITVTVNPIPTLTITPASATICSGSSTTLTASGASTYSWNTGSTTAAITVSPGTTTNYNVTGSLNGCTGTAAATVTLNTVTPSTVATDQTLCSGASAVAFNITNAATGAGALTYQWQSSINNGTSWADIPSATTATYSPGVVSQTTLYHQIVTSTLNGIICTANSNFITITTSPVTAGTVAADQTICSGSVPAPFTNVSLGTASGGGATLTYQWQVSTNGGTTWTDIPGANATTYTPAALSQTTIYRRAARGVRSGGSGYDCTVYSNIITVTVNQAATANAGTIQTVCAGGTITLAGSIGGGATTSTWSAPSGTFSNALSLTSTYTPSITSGTVTLTLTTNDPDGAGPCLPATSTVIITVNPKPSPIITHN